MAATQTNKPGRIILTAIDADWTSSRELWIAGLFFNPGNANDVMVIKDDTDAGNILWNVTAATAETVVFYRPFRATPMVDFSACTLNTGHQLTIFTV